MKLISLNTWGGRLFKPLIDFIRKKSSDTDIFCFQEVFLGKNKEPGPLGSRSNLFDELSEVLSDFTPYHHEAPRDFPFYGQIVDSLTIGQVTFVRKKFNVKDSGGFYTYRGIKDQPKTLNGNFHYVEVEVPDRKILIGNLHGLHYHGWGKDDTPSRDHQTQEILNFFEERGGFNGKVLIGDFNLRPETRSIAAFGSRMHNLIKEYKIPNTRTRHYADMEKYKDYIADYCFTSSDIVVKDFRVLPDEVSDHSPLCLEFE